MTRARLRKWPRPSESLLDEVGFWCWIVLYEQSPNVRPVGRRPVPEASSANVLSLAGSLY